MMLKEKSFLSPFLLLSLLWLSFGSAFKEAYTPKSLSTREKQDVSLGFVPLEKKRSLPSENKPPLKKNHPLSTLAYETNFVALSHKKVDDVQKHFSLVKFHLHNPRHVPRVFLSFLPKDIHNLPTEKRKNFFIQSHLPLILKINEDIEKDRQRLLALKKTYQEKGFLSETEKAWIYSLADYYRLKTKNISDKMFEHLEERVDVLPVSMALAQAIVESGWGTSYAALHKNSTFGMTIDQKVKMYDCLLACVEGYMRNVNTNPAYRTMRYLRRKMRHENKSLCSLALMGCLWHYCERRHAYIQQVRSIITFNNLKRFDHHCLVSSFPSQNTRDI